MEIAVVLNNIRSVYNVASIFRTADGARSTGSGQAGVSKIYLIGVTPTPLDRFGNFRKDFSKVALGAEKTVEWEYAKSFGTVYKKLRNPPAGGGYEILAVEQDRRAIPYYQYTNLRSQVSVLKRLALVFGEETKGLPKSVLDKADKILEIPMRGAMVRQAHHPKNKKNFKLPGKAPLPFDKTQGRQAPTIAKALVGGQGKESLNVSVAAGIVIYSLAYQC